MKPYQGNDAAFLAACAAARIQPTDRQWKKWQKGRGTARHHQRRAEAERQRQAE